MAADFDKSYQQFRESYRQLVADMVFFHTLGLCSCYFLSMYKLVVFDLDGTLLDTIGDLAFSCNYALGKGGFPLHDISEYYGFVGNGIMKLIERALPEEYRTPPILAKMKEIFIAHYSANNTVRTKPYDGIPELVGRLQDAGAVMAVASNKYQEATEKIVRHFFPDIRFSDILGQREGIPIKPDPHIIYEIMRNAGAAPEETIYAGDSKVDAATASRIEGITAVAVTWGFCPRTVLETCGTKILADSPNDIWDLFIGK